MDLYRSLSETSEKLARSYLYIMRDGHLDVITCKDLDYLRSWPTIFTRPSITHFEEKNSRPDF